MTPTDLHKVKLQLVGSSQPKSGTEPGASQQQNFPDGATRIPQSPATKLPEPDTWYARSPIPVPERPSPIPAGKDEKGSRTIAIVDVANRIIQACKEKHGAMVGEDKRCWLYRDGYHYPVTEDWVDDAVYAYDGQEGLNQVDGKPMVFRYDPQTSFTTPLMIYRRLRMAQLDTPGRYFDEPLAIPFSGCSLDLATLCPVEHSPLHRASWAYDVEYDDESEPIWLPLVMRDWFAGLPEEEISLRILALRQYAGHTLLGTLPRMKLSTGLMLVGGGHDGKTVFIELVKACLPPGMVKDVDPGELTSKSLAVDITRATLLGKMANVCDDCTGQTWHDTGFIKRLLDHGTMNVRKQGKDGTELHWRGATIYACNALPSVRDTSHGFQRRWRMIEFPNEIPVVDREPRIVAMLMSHERQAIINWFVSAAVAMLKGPANAVIAKPACHDVLMAQWMGGDDGVAEWMAECCSDPGDDKAHWMATAAAYEAFAARFLWLHGRSPMGRDAFCKRLAALGVARSRRGHANERVVRLATRRDQ